VEVEVWDNNIEFEVLGIAWLNDRTLLLHDHENVYRLDVERSLRVNRKLYVRIKNKFTFKSQNGIQNKKLKAIGVLFPIYKRMYPIL